MTDKEELTPNTHRLVIRRRLRSGSGSRGGGEISVDVFVTGTYAYSTTKGPVERPINREEAIGFARTVEGFQEEHQPMMVYAREIVEESPGCWRIWVYQDWLD